MQVMLDDEMQEGNSIHLVDDGKEHRVKSIVKCET